jgi:hypothetical protein
MFAQEAQHWTVWDELSLRVEDKDWQSCSSTLRLMGGGT